jgi:hypothetical protein
MPKQAKMLPLEELRAILSPDKLPLPKFPRVEEIKVVEYEDWTGDDSLDVFAIVEDAAPEDETIGPLVRPIRQAIHDAINRAGETRFPYILIGTRADYDQRNSYDPDEDHPRSSRTGSADGTGSVSTSNDRE